MDKAISHSPSAVEEGIYHPIILATTKPRKQSCNISDLFQMAGN